jgi:hypothetical protein
VAKYAEPGEKPVWRIYHAGSSLHFGMDYPNQKAAMAVATKMGDHLDWTKPQDYITGKRKNQYMADIKALKDDPESDLNASKPADRFAVMTSQLEVEAMVNKAAVLVESQGKAAFSEFRKRDSEWWFGNTLSALIRPSLPVRQRRAARAIRERVWRDCCGSTTCRTPRSCAARSLVREAKPPSATASRGG